ncbi:MAG: hypothetical protein KAU35_05815 [candidate division Zixibacteria bacterium]|nr:hypothetical protein [candidate division Zixibacteria bacterium]
MFEELDNLSDRHEVDEFVTLIVRGNENAIQASTIVLEAEDKHIAMNELIVNKANSELSMTCLSLIIELINLMPVH